MYAYIFNVRLKKAIDPRLLLHNGEYFLATAPLTLSLLGSEEEGTVTCGTFHHFSLFLVAMRCWLPQKCHINMCETLDGVNK